ncbi:MAG: hypothetical protein ACTHK2_19165 [Dokdonella sp.]|uniref:hypothetical protein n=1 Tax=Dokdonella sp. TaxID=2291710 RepID=UPI003F7F414E
MTVHLANVRKAALAAALFLGPAAAYAANPVGNAEAHDFSIHINLIGLTSLDVASQTSASLVDVVDSAADSDQLPSISISDPLNLMSLNSGELIAETEYVGNAVSAIAAQSTVADLDLSVATALLDVLSLGSGVIRSTTTMSGYCPAAASNAPRSLLGDFVFGYGFDQGNLNGGGDPGGGLGGGLGGLPPGGVDLIDPSVTILGIPVPGLPTNPPPNTSIDLSALGIAGVTLVLNEQTRTGDGVHSLTLATNGIHLGLNVAGLVTGDVIVAHSEVGMACP